jgi:diaminohydroxyphosphoribosylaminopyrimidine deaminase/5-amino-6-(5-phosphoribosylamino)uracil reductase
MSDKDQQAFSVSDHEYMTRALRLAEQGLYTAHPNPRVGCVVVRDGAVVGEGWHARAGEAHAEIAALEQAGEQSLGATVYVTLEPCSHQGRTPPCAEALIQAGVARVVCALQDPNPQVNGEGIRRLREAGVRVESGLRAGEAERINPGFCARMRRGRPYVRVKLAMSLDGRTALRSGESQWITGENARLDVQRWRARSSAIMSGIHTVLADDPAFSLRLEGLVLTGELTSGRMDAIRPPLRIILDSRLHMPLNAQLLKLPGDILIVTASDDAAKREALSGDHVEVITLPVDEAGRPELHDLMNVLAEAQINEVLVESGATLAGALLDRQLIDELIVYVAPVVLGHTARGLFKLPALADMQSRIPFEFTDIRPVGPDLRIQLKPVYKKG